MSPLLANIALSALDEHFDQQWHQRWAPTSSGTGADSTAKATGGSSATPTTSSSWCPANEHHAEALREEVSAVIAPLGLRLAPDKTRVVHIDEGFDFLGFHIRRMRKRGTNKYVRLHHPSKKAIASIKDRVKAKTYRSTRHRDLDELISSSTSTGSLGGWANYFRHGVSKAVFSAVDYHAWGRMSGLDAAKKHRIGSAERTPPPLLLTRAGGSPTTGSCSPAPPASP